MINEQTDSPTQEYEKAKARLLTKSTKELLNDLLIDCNYRDREATKIMLDYRFAETNLNILDKMNHSTNILLAFAILSFVTALITLGVAFIK
jgi:hypothetical protein